MSLEHDARRETIRSEPPVLIQGRQKDCSDRTIKGARVLHLMVPEMFREKAISKVPAKIRDWKLMPHQAGQKSVE